VDPILTVWAQALRHCSHTRAARNVSGYGNAGCPGSYVRLNEYELHESSPNAFGIAGRDSRRGRRHSGMDNGGFRDTGRTLEIKPMIG
jgi:hypothetical protein